LEGERVSKTPRKVDVEVVAGARFDDFDHVVHLRFKARLCVRIVVDLGKTGLP
jgi:hypothetical protein